MKKDPGFLCYSHAPCLQMGCTKCCEHEEMDEGICADCGQESDMGEMIDNAQYNFED